MSKFKLLLFVLVCVSLQTFGQAEKYNAYIKKYKDLAITQMKKYNVPASITMAQALIESTAGTSYLATEAKNHFGIKVGGTWTGPYVLRNDDAPNEKFRKYAFVEDSYEDHSLFLVRGRRYASLFQLPITDYRGWAYGLKAAGYATHPDYAVNLINLIELYNLTDLDQEAFAKTHPERSAIQVPATPPAQTASEVPRQMVAHSKHTIGINNHNFYIIASATDTYSSLSQEYDVSESKLRRYNEVTKRIPLKAGDIVYFQKKQRKAHKLLRGTTHTLRQGESLYLLSQMYGMRLKTLYKLNGFKSDYTPKVGDHIWIR